MANSVPAIKEAMLRETGAPSIEALFEQIPDAHRTKHEFALPPALRSEPELRRHMLSLLAKNRSCEDLLSFLGAGIWQHHVPAICDEIAGRSEFLTSVWGTPMSDHGRNQAWFEFCSQLGELSPATSSGCRCIPGAAPRATPSAWRRASTAAATCWCRRGWTRNGWR
jgi:glycine dehydrogenase subunit 1